MTTIIETSGLQKSYGQHRALSGLSLRIDAGVVFGFLGPNGSGKTTAIRILLGFLRPSFGAARVFGRDCWRESAAIKRDVGYVAGDLRLYSSLSGRATIRIAGKIRGEDFGHSARELAERFELDLDRKVHTLSRGTRQKLGLVLALAPDPRLVVLDEPTSGLDPVMQERLRALLRERADAGRTVFFSSHTLSEVENVCDRVGILREGELVADTTLLELRARAAREVRITWRAGTAAPTDAPPPELEVTERTPSHWSGRLSGAAGPLLQWLAPHRPDDVAISEPDLQSVFHRYYEESEPS